MHFERCRLGLRYIGKPQVVYSTKRAAIVQFVKVTAVIYAPRRVRLNTVVPGLTETPYAKTLAARFPMEGGYEAFKKMRDDEVAMVRTGDAWDVAITAAFLVSDEAKYITGQKVEVDVGITSSTGRTWTSENLPLTFVECKTNTFAFLAFDFSHHHLETNPVVLLHAGRMVVLERLLRSVTQVAHGVTS